MFGTPVRAPADGGSEEEEDEVAPAFQDPISFGVMSDPVLLVGTGQVYDYSSLVAWFCTGSRRCPKTNIPLLDIEVSPGWCRATGMVVGCLGARRHRCACS